MDGMDTWMEWDRQAYGRKNDRQEDRHTIDGQGVLRLVQDAGDILVIICVFVRDTP